MNLPSQPISADHTATLPPTQPASLRQRLRRVLQERLAPSALIDRYVGYCQEFVEYHLGSAPQEMGAIQVEQFLHHLRHERGLATGEARQALTVLYTNVLHRPEALQPRLLERVQAVLRVRHYALRTEPGLRQHPDAGADQQQPAAAVSSSHSN